MNIAILAGRDPHIRTDTDGGSVYLEYLQAKLRADHHAVTTYIPRGVRGGLISKERSAQQQSGTCGGNGIIYFPVDDTAPRDAIISEEDYFFRRIEISNTFVDYFSDRKLFKYDVVFVLHCANAFGIARHNLLPFDRTVLFPMMTSAHYRKFTAVPDSYVRHERETLTRMQHISTPSDDERSALTNVFSVSDSVVFKTHRGFSPDDFPFARHLPPRNRKRITIFSANGIRPQKDHEFFIKVGRALLSLGIVPNIVLTGNNGRSHNPHYNAYAEAFWRRVRDAHMERYIVAHDVVPRSRLVSLMRSADIALYPSVAETFGKSALESVVSGLPTFVFDDVPAFSEFITHNRTGIVTPRNAVVCAREIIDLCIKNVQRYEHIAANGASLRNPFSWSTIMDTLFKQLRQRGIM